MAYQEGTSCSGWVAMRYNGTMLRLLLTLLFTHAALSAVEIIDRPVPFSSHRIALTKQYIQTHYGLSPDTITIVPRIIVVHHTAIDDLNASWGVLAPEALPSRRSDIAGGGSVNVSAHFLVDRDGSIYRLMPETFMGRHVIGLNYDSIGIENVGGGPAYPQLSEAQIAANDALIRDLKQRFPSIRYLIGHYEYRCFESTPLWRELDPGYRTVKDDPHPASMRAIRESTVKLAGAPCEREGE